MPHNVLSAGSIYREVSRVCCLSAAAAAFLLLHMPSAATAQNAGGAVAASGNTMQQAAPTQQQPAAAVQKNSIIKLTAEQDGKNLKISIFCAKPPEQMPVSLELPDRKGIVIDILNAELSKPATELSAPLAKFKVKVGGIDKPDAGSNLLHFEFYLPESYASYNVSVKDSSIVLLIEGFFKDTAAPTTTDTAPVSIPAVPLPSVGGKDDGKKNTAETSSGKSIEVPLPTVTPTIKAAGGAAAPGGNSVAGASLFGGTGGAPITVDFYKVDLHNVFRLLGEVSGYNIIIAEGVSGTLTLALREVPWDFVLDVILNLKDLAKEQRFNTIVIYPKGKDFSWPQRSAADASLKMEPESTGPKSPIVIAQGGGSEQTQPSEVMEAKKLVTLGIRAEKEGSIETAVQLYEKGLDIWPDKTESKEKSKLANKIASIYLGKLNQNAKAVYYAKKALASDKKNSSAALNVAIGHANMEEASQAQQYFDQSISVGQPSREALFSYAVFSERQRQYEAALKLLNKYSDLYGEDLNSMIARARILDQQGRQDEADKAYTAILHAGFSVPQDLRAYIMSRTRSH